ncbi:MAG: chromosome segregation protein SMC [Christensenellaceae bacterium]
MNFEKIEIIGFKSFADKMEIVFDNGVTGIVGPNGCGKSNIADAIRWVLGEQSAKSLRGSQMTDVIFNGTQNRKLLSYCEVSLYFDNSNKLFPSCEYSEVILTRKLFRDGTSEYYVNKQPARMRDIVNLLHECGVSKNGYSIIGQGKVSEILSSKPEDRRTIFEEAVGIAKTKAEKIENERKLERTRDNIKRIVDITSELERQLGPAQRAAEKAKKSFELYEQLKYNEINTYLYKYENSSVQKEKINLRIKGLAEELAVRERELADTNASYMKHMNDVTLFDTRINELNEKILDETVKQERNEGNTKLLREKISYLKSDIQRLQGDIDEKTEKISLSEKAIAAKTQIKVTYEKEIESLNNEATVLNAKIKSITDRIAEGESAAQNAQSKVLQSADALYDISRNIGSLDTEKNVISSQQREVLEKVNALSVHYHKLDDECNQLSKQIEYNTAKQKSVSANIDECEKDISAYNQKTSDISNKIYKLNFEVNSLEANRGLYKDIKDSYSGYQESVKTLMNNAKTNTALAQKVMDVVANIIKIDSKYEVAISTALGNTVQNIVTRTSDDARYIIEYLKRNDIQSVTFLPISSVKIRQDGASILSALKKTGALGLATELVRYDAVYENIIKHLLGNTLVVDNISNAVEIAKLYSFGFKIVTLDGDVINPTGSMTGGSRSRKRSSLLSTDAKIEQITAMLEAKRSEAKALQEEKLKYENIANGLVDKLDSLNAELQTLRLDLTSLKEKLNSYSQMRDNCKEDIDKNNEAIEQIASRLNDISLKYIDIEIGNKKLLEEKENASDDAQRHQQTFDKLKSERDSLIDENNKKLSRLSYLNYEIKSISDELLRLNNEIADCNQIINKDNINIVADKNNIEECTNKISEITKLYEETSGIKELKGELNYYVDKKSKLSDLIQQDNLKKDLLSAEISKNHEKRHSEELAISKIDSELEYMQQRVEEEYKLTYETCKDMRDPEYNFAASQQTITDLKRKLSSLGPVNPSACEEYEQVKSRYDEFMIQRADLEKGEADIKKAISQLANEMLTTFNDGFEKIRGHFQLIFKQLFGGGKADLVLDYSNCEDPLDAGVEIVAEPPGKKLQKISLLSGGEMSLTAIAILFAILKLRPMPFCVLDEIEAALDDANVERFARYLQNFSKETQFIVITHKKVTMELSDALFGVTMQEKGVSKIISVKLSDIKDVVTDID